MRLDECFHLSINPIGKILITSLLLESYKINFEFINFTISALKLMNKELEPDLYLEDTENVKNSRIPLS